MNCVREDLFQSDTNPRPTETCRHTNACTHTQTHANTNKYTPTNTHRNTQREGFVCPTSYRNVNKPAPIDLSSVCVYVLYDSSRSLFHSLLFPSLTFFSFSKITLLEMSMTELKHASLWTAGFDTKSYQTHAGRCVWSSWRDTHSVHSERSIKHTYRYTHTHTHKHTHTHTHTCILLQTHKSLTHTTMCCGLSGAPLVQTCPSKLFSEYMLEYFTVFNTM